MISISLCMIVKDEEKNLDNCLKGIAPIVDEVIIVDTGSTDKTKEIAKQYTSFIYDFEWGDNFAEARNFSFSKATKDYIMWMDADDVLPESEGFKLLALKQGLDSSIDAVFMKYEVPAGQEEMRQIFWRERLVKRSKQFKWHNPVHEYIDCEGNFKGIDITLYHAKQYTNTKRNLEIYEKYIAGNHELSNRDYFYYAGELLKDQQVDEAISYYEKFLETKGELTSNYLNACIKLASCYNYKKDKEKCLKALLRYLEIDGPRAEICCQIGYYYKEKELYNKAIEWFKMAPVTTMPINDIGGITPLCWDYIPYMEICACYFRMGEVEKAITFNEMAAKVRPYDEKILYNRVFLAATLKEKVKGKLQGSEKIKG